MYLFTPTAKIQSATLSLEPNKRLLKKWGLATIAKCPCGKPPCFSCRQTKLEGGLLRLHSADIIAVWWLTAHDL